MNDSDEKLRQWLKQSISPVDYELEHDLWPQMLNRLGEHSAAVPWFDWALLAGLALWFILSPAGIPLLLYHL